MAKHPSAVELGRLGGLASSQKKTAAVRRNGLLGGRPPSYRLVDGELYQRAGDLWLTLGLPYDAAARRWLRRHR